MVYVFDTSSFIVTGHYYRQQFPRFWEKFNFAVNQSKIISVREVYKELGNEPKFTNIKVVITIRL